MALYDKRRIVRAVIASIFALEELLLLCGQILAAVLSNQAPPVVAKSSHVSGGAQPSDKEPKLPTFFTAFR